MSSTLAGIYQERDFRCKFDKGLSFRYKRDPTWSRAYDAKQKPYSREGCVIVAELSPQRRERKTIRQWLAEFDRRCKLDRGPSFRFSRDPSFTKRVSDLDKRGFSALDCVDVGDTIESSPPI